MAEETAGDQVEQKKKSVMPTIAIALSGMLGVTVATVFVAPRVVASRPVPVISPSSGGEHAAAEPSGGGHSAQSSGGHGGGGESETGEFVELGNILVNPAGSNGLRFLMVSVTFEVQGGRKAAVDELRQRDAQLRDVVLEQYSLERLTAPGARDTIKVKLGTAVEDVFNTPVRVFMPQFVIN